MCSQGWTKAFKTWSPITAGSPTNLTVFLWWFKCMCVCVFSPQLFKGKFFICQGEDVRNITNKSDCLQASYKWVRHKYNFDNLGQVRHSKCQDSWWTDAWIKKNWWCWSRFSTVFNFSPCLRFNPVILSQALMSLFVLASKDGWVDIMYDGLDAVGVDQQVNVKLRTQNVGKSLGCSI